MYYRVGHWKDYSFVYDSDDNSCEMIRDVVLGKSSIGVENLFVKYFDINKMRMLYGFKEDQIDCLYSKKLVGFTAKMDEGNTRVDTRFTLTMYIIPKQLIIYSEYRNLYSEYGSTENYLLFIDLDTGLLHLNHYDNPYLHQFRVYNSVKFNGIILPQSMAVYILQLVGEYNLGGILSSLDGLFSEKLVLWGYADYYKYYFNSNYGFQDIIWG